MLCASAVVAAGALLSACGSETHPNDPRPPIPQVLNVTIADDEILVSPEILNRPGHDPMNISQNEDAPVNQADQDAPAVVDVAISNLTSQDTEMVIEGPVEAEQSLTPSGSGSLRTALPTGIYRVSSPASSATKRFAVGRSRVSSNSDLLTP
jgi:hypothetical protein